MRLSKDLVNKAVVTIDDGRIVGHVKDIYLTADLSEMAGIFMGKEGIIRRKSLLIPADSVVIFGIDVVLVNSADAATNDREYKEAANWVRLDKLQGREIDTPGGTRVGTVGDVVLGEEGEIVAFSLSRVMVEGPIAEKRVIYKHAIIDNGNDDGIMTINLERAENPTMVVAEPTPAPAAPVAPAAESKPSADPAPAADSAESAEPAAAADGTETDSTT